MPRKSKSWFGLKSVCCGVLALVLAASAADTFAQQSQVVKSPQSRQEAADKALLDANVASLNKIAEIERLWREAFRNARSRDRLKGFVGETLNIFEKLLQVRDMAVNPGGTDARITDLFRKRIMNPDKVCALLEDTLRDFCNALDEHDQAMFIELKIDREVGRTTVSRSIVDPASYRGPINEAAASAVKAAQDDMARSLASFAASEGLGTVAKRIARDLGLNRTEEGSAADFVTGLLIDIGVGMAVDAATDPTPKMIANLEKRLQQAEQTILDGTASSPGFLKTLHQIWEKRVCARMRVIESELRK